MKVLFTGGSSFTGHWFVRELAAAGHEVAATFRRSLEDYPDALRRRRIQALKGQCRIVSGCSFGDERFLRLLRDEGPWDLLCHHAAEVTNYKSPDFDVQAALLNNTRNLPLVLSALSTGGCRRILLTGSVFEQDEGAGSEGLPAFSPYGLSKGLTAQVFRYYTAARELHLGKFVIPNPFGPLEDPRFVTYLMKTWHARAVPVVNTPSYVRDNIHISLLAKAYARFVASLPASPGISRLHPSGYIESQGAFAQRVASEMRDRLSLPCGLEFRTQTIFTEPRVRINTDPLDAAELGWSEAAAWEALASFYDEVLGTP
jgi:nucleoside-diphosphate-sugar epimerase